MTLCAPWITDTDICGPCLESLYAADPDMVDLAIQTASETLYELSGQQFPGICSETITPCIRTPLVTWRQWAGLTALQRTGWFYWGGCGCHRIDSCGCQGFSVIQLPRTPIVSIEEIIIDGYLLDPSLYELRGDMVVRLDRVAWPCCDDSFTITYTYGTEVPLLGQKAAGILACEYLMSCDPEAFPGQCRLPRNVAQLTRQGVSVIFQSLLSSRRFRFGIWEIDMFIETYNPRNIIAPSTIITPDTVPLGRKMP